MGYGKSTAPGTVSPVSFNLKYSIFTTAQIRDDQLKWTYYMDVL